MDKKKKSYIFFASIVVLGVVIDLLTKILFEKYFVGGGKEIVVIPNFFSFTYVKNTGAAFGIFGESTLALSIASLFFIGVFVTYDIFYHSNNLWYVFGISMLISGAIGNFVDRIFLGYVRDFINIEIFPFVFNFADALITFGVICFGVFLVFFGYKDGKKEKKDKSEKKTIDDKNQGVNVEADSLVENVTQNSNDASENNDEKTLAGDLKKSADNDNKDKPNKKRKTSAKALDGREDASKDGEVDRKDKEVDPKDKEFATKDRGATSKDKEVVQKDKKVVAQDKEFTTKDKGLATKDRNFTTKNSSGATKDKEHIANKVDPATKKDKPIGKKKTAKKIVQQGENDGVQN